MTLTDTQSLLLAHAARNEAGSLYPLPSTLTSAAGAARSIVALVKRGLAEEREIMDAGHIARTDVDIRHGVFATAAGLAAIGVSSGADEDVVGEGVAPPPPAPAPRTTKTDTVLSLLQRDDGATLADLIAATGWLPHTTRAALTGLRHKGHQIERFKHDGVKTYRIAGAA
ncbi:DUF3489 domain-containing protein [Sphingomonas adhaesiva]|uniref:DUF3489 domain-containing protein n=1 Tax=Sphingomonas adhaesiva TaxID=28212 RepID=UPI002FFAA049